MTRTYFIRDEYKPRFGRQVLTIWSGAFASDFEGNALELPDHNGFMVSVDGMSIRASCPSPRTEENYLDVDELISQVINDAMSREVEWPLVPVIRIE